MSSPENLLVVFARTPRPGKVKTRLIPALTAEEACGVHVAFLGDVLERAARALAGKARILLSWSERTPAAAGTPLPDGVEAVFQPPGDLGERMARTIQERLQGGVAKVVILGSDSPTLPSDHLIAAFQSLESRQVVLGPALDGGYYLVGMSRLHPEIFRKIRWGTPEVLSVTRLRLKSSGVEWHELGPWRDVDTPGDLDHLWREIQHLGKRHPEDVPHRTRSILSSLGGGPFGPPESDS